jgi:HEXXH motif-containing protein
MTRLETAKYQACCQPPKAGNASVVDTAVSEHARIYTELFLERHRVAIGSRSEGIVDCIETWLNSRMRFEVTWNPVFGLVREATLRPVLDPLAVSALLCLHLNARGFGGDFEADFATPVHLRWSNAVLPRTRRIRIQTAGDRSFVTLHRNSKSRFALSHGKSRRAWEATQCHLFPAVQLDERNRCLVVPHEPGNHGFETGRAAGSLDAERRCVAAAIELLRQSTPRYARWVSRVVRELVVLRTPAGILSSCSNAEWPGKIQMSLPRQAAEVAEMLVHEGSHQYFHIVQMADAVCDEDDNRLYYSPVKGTERPIEMILLAFHAFANVALFYKACMAKGLDDTGYCRKNLARHLPELDDLKRHLETCDSLTPAGRLLWKPLAELVF